jgi:hypothetical protein
MSHKRIIKVISLLLFDFEEYSFLMLYLWFRLSKLYICFFYLFIYTLRWSIWLLVMNFPPEYHGVLRLVKLFTFFVIIIEDWQIGPADSLRIYVFFCDLRLDHYWFALDDLWFGASDCSKLRWRTSSFFRNHTQLILFRDKILYPLTIWPWSVLHLGLLLGDYRSAQKTFIFLKFDYRWLIIQWGQILISTLLQIIEPWDIRSAYIRRTW